MPQRDQQGVQVTAPPRVPGGRWASRAWLGALGLVLAGSASIPAQAQPAARRGAENRDHPCGMIYTNHFGPLDYRKQRAGIQVVEDYHFTPRVERLIGGASSSIGADLNYTLRASPNHHRALVAAVRFTDRNRQQQMPGMEFPIECYFDRAIRFAPDDTIVRGLYAQFLHKRQRKPDALAQLQAAVNDAGDNGWSHHSLGMVYLEMGEHELALAQAHRALALGFDRPDLAEALKKTGHWRAPAPAPAAPASAAGTAQAAGASAAEPASGPASR